jgi:hypothetical protein
VEHLFAQVLCEHSALNVQRMSPFGNVTAAVSAALSASTQLRKVSVTILKSIVKLALVCALAAAASATTFVSTSGSITGTLVVDSNTFAIQAFDVRGSETLDVFDSGANLLGSVALFDLGSAPPNSLLMGANGAFSESGVLTLDGLNGVVSGSDFLVGSGGVPNGTVTDAALLQLLNPLVFDFTFGTTTQISDTQLAFSLTLNQVDAVPQSTTPEPATMSLLLGPLFVGTAWGWRKRLARR